MSEQPRERKYSTGEIIKTVSGRDTTPFPKVDLSSDRKATNTVKRVDQWLYDNAIDEAVARGDDFNATMFRGEDPKKLPPATKDSMNEYLFGLFGSFPFLMSNITRR